MKGLKISNLEQLELTANKKKAVVVPNSSCWNRPLPAAFLLMQQGGILLKLFRSGMYIYEKPKKTKKPKPMTWQTKKREESNE